MKKNKYYVLLVVVPHHPITDCTNIVKNICDLIKYESIYVW